MAKFLVIDVQGLHDGNPFEDCRTVHDSYEDMVKALSEEGETLLSDSVDYFGDWGRNLEIYEIKEKLPCPIMETTVSVSFPEPDPIPPAADEFQPINLAEARRQRDRLERPWNPGMFMN